MIGHILRHHGTCSDESVRADCEAAENSRIGAEGRALSNERLLKFHAA